MVINEALSGRKRCCKDLTIVCLGENCAAWRWVWNQENVNKDGESVIQNTRTDYGYCGLAGMPMYPLDEIKLLKALGDDDGE